ncbi:MAG TPA: hypothetical protein VF101_09695 [Gaiellaceae bacterium]
MKPQQVLLPAPRPLASDERALLDALLAGPRSRPELIEQAATARVIGECSCGCPSVWLRADNDTPPLTTTASESPTGDPSYYSLTAHGQNTDGREVQVTLHVARGRLDELEIWAGEEGETTLPPTDGLRYSTDS